jgi:hypothetical protein
MTKVTTRTRRQGSQNRYRTASFQSRFYEDLSDFPDAPLMLTEGDSWFAWPVNGNIIRKIGKYANFNILRLERNGDEIVENIMSPRQRNKIEDALSRFDFPVFLVSGGGNDIVGDELRAFLKRYRKNMVGWRSILRDNEFESALGLIKTAYIDLIELTYRYRPNCIILAHDYDFIEPSDNGAEFFGFSFGESWIKPTMDELKIPDDWQEDIVDHMLQRLSQELADLQATYPSFIHVRTQGTLKKGDPKHWANEIHPTPAGFELIAKKFLPHLKRITPEAF